MVPRQASLFAAFVTAGLLGALAPPARAQEPRGGIRVDDDCRFVVPLDDTGVADWQYLNPRRPGVPDRTRCKYREGEGVEVHDPLEASFLNRSSSRTLAVRLKVENKSGGTCPPPGAGKTWTISDDKKTCDLSLRLDAARGRGLVPLDDLRHILNMRLKMLPECSDPTKPCPAVEAVVTFSVEFFAEAEKPARSSGRFLLTHRDMRTIGDAALLGFESQSKSGLSLAASLAASRGPAVGDSTVFTSESPFVGDELGRFPAEGTVTLKQNLGSRADAEVTVGFRDGELGGDGVSLKTTRYLVNAYNVRGIHLSLGRFKFAEPTGGIAVRDSGDGFRLGFRNYTVAHIIKRESAAGKADAANDDNSVWIARAENLSFASLPGIRYLSLYASRGNERALKDQGAIGEFEPGDVFPHEYHTVGAELGFPVPGTDLGGSLGAYHSWRRGADLEGRGTTALLTLSHSVGGRKVPNDPNSAYRETHQFSLRLGMGTGDDPATGKDEGYVGESPSFAPDSIFLASMATRLNSGGRLLAPALSNKVYLGAAWSNLRFSPLALIAGLLGQESDVESKASRIAWHHYRFREAVNGDHDAGTEVSLTFEAETPKGVQTRLTGAYFFTGDALRPLFEKRPWMVSASVKVSLDP